MTYVPPIVSFLIPSRNRVHGLEAAIASIQQTCHDPRNVEVIVRLDDDDVDSLKFMEHLSEYFLEVNIITIVGPRHGYQNLHRYYTEMYEASNGAFLFVFNDDTIMGSEWWDLSLGEYRYTPCVINPAWNHPSLLNTFPIIHRTIPEKLGVFCEHIFIDQWYHYLAEAAGCHINLREGEKRIVVNHLGDTDRRAHGSDGQFPALTEAFTPEPFPIDRIHELAKRL
jgi:hypothetical protein